jgi:hypothetical protein
MGVRGRVRRVALLKLGVAVALAVLNLLSASVSAASPALSASPSTGGIDPGGDWPMLNHDPSHSGYNSGETTLSKANIDQLTFAWKARVDKDRYETRESQPVVSHGVVYIGSTLGTLYAFPARCAGSGDCPPLWTATVGSPIVSTPAVADGVVYVGSEGGKLFAFAVGCATGGGTCTPVWTATVGSVLSSPTVADGVVYVGDGGRNISAFAVGCASGGVTCSPLWTAELENPVYKSPAVGGGHVYISVGTRLYAFRVGCASGGKTCQPAWSAGNSNPPGNNAPSVVDGVVYVGTWSGSKGGKLLAFPADCARDCSSIWSASPDSGYVLSSPAVANGMIFVVSGESSVVVAYKAGCNSGGKACTPVWTAARYNLYYGLSVANGLVFAASGDGNLIAYSVDCATGGATCEPLWTQSVGAASVWSQPVISNGAVYVMGHDGYLYAFALPASATPDSTQPQASSSATPDSGATKSDTGNAWPPLVPILAILGALAAIVIAGVVVLRRRSGPRPA